MTGGLMKTTTSRLALAAIASVVATGAYAADLGGNCCVDLEERVAELEATTARKGNRKVSLTISGQVVKEMLYHDHNATNSFRTGDLQFRDGDNNGTRFRFLGTAKVTSDWTFGYLLEINVNEDFATGTTVSNATAGTAVFNIRQSNFYATSKTLGTVTIGQQSTAMDGVPFVNLASAGMPGVNVGDNMNPFAIGGSYDTIFNTDGVFDGIRRTGIKYTSPTVAGFIVSSGWYHADQSYDTTAFQSSDGYRDNDEIWDVTLRYAGEFNGIRLAAAVGYQKLSEYNQATPTADASFDTISGSASAMHVPTGLFLSAGYGSVDYASTATTQFDRTFWHAVGGIQKNFFGIGNTTLYGEYTTINVDTTSNSRVSSNCVSGGVAANVALTTAQCDGSFWGVGMNQSIDAAATDLFIAYRKYDSNGLVGGDVQTLQVGTSIKF